jgi:Spy/CpxP family protein refolding chaperone
MNRIRTAAATVAMLVGAATVATAQAPAPQHGQHRQDGKANQGARGMMGDLNLTDAQKEQLKAIHANYRTQNTAAATALQQQQQAEIRAILTAEQRVKFDARHAQMRERMAQRDSTQRKAGAREGKRGRRPMRGARPGRAPGQG